MLRLPVDAVFVAQYFGENAIDSDEVERYEATYIATQDGTECFTIDKATFIEATKKNLDAFKDLSGTPKEGDIDALIDAIDQDGDGTFSRAEVAWHPPPEHFIKRIDGILFARACWQCLVPARHRRCCLVPLEVITLNGVRTAGSGSYGQHDQPAEITRAGKKGRLRSVLRPPICLRINAGDYPGRK